jgi:NRPS condensation-like uncharacterized protein
MKIPRRFRTYTADQGMDILSDFFVPRIQLLTDLEGPLDPDRLSDALRLSLDAEPVLGCRWVPRWIWPYWERLEKVDPNHLLKTDQTVEEFLGADFDEKQHPQIQALLTKDNRLVLKVNHQVADAGGTKEVGYLVAKMYRELGKDPSYRPEPNLGSRSLKQVYRRFIPRRFFGLLGRVFRELWGNIRPLKSINWLSTPDRTGAPIHIFKHFSKERLDTARSQVAEIGPTLNDLMVTASLRAIAKHTNWNKNGVLRMTGTVDLRRYLPKRKGAAICNLSSFYFVNLGHDLGANFIETLSRVKQQIDRLKTDYFGLSFIFGGYLMFHPYPFALTRRMMRWFFRYLLRKGNFPPAVTNMGEIDDALLDFGSPRVASAFLAVPAGQPPVLAPGLTGFRNSLTMSAGFYESAYPRPDMETLLNLIDNELPG